ncbi:hypothetical protein EDD37DRAFT_84686 [Exophiala viscosa]|uniref:Zn(2)-C6 fungal-type domain-containing protein n=1 Tax=Exophiala viscosa TaxID=2486360 RepID=A0AAN6E134_9EURO|nr:hypothetical protein EDD36DRAFT_131515 [Exophiala viscosa]KAI1630157.1 hypothetical protein EDD37DRAFT_84686 [Exophiala viscosa]
MSTVAGRIKKVERACKPCRDLKVRCLPCVERDDICQKCKRSGARCVLEDPKPRKKRKTNNDRGSVLALQAKVAELKAQLEERKASSQGDTATGPSNVPLVGTANTATICSDDSRSQDAMPDWSQYPSNAQDSCDGHCPSSKSVVGELLRSGQLMQTAAASYLSGYRHMCTYFPFVILADDASIEQLMHSQPFSLHAILVVSSGDNEDLQTTLEKSFREELLRAVMFDGKNNIDLLQALVVYLAWYHFFYIPMKQQFYQILQIAIGMCIDMKLDRPPERATARKMGLEESHEDDNLLGDTSSEQYYSKAARRAYIGCYCISTAASWVWCKPNNFPYNDYLVQCARSLSDDPENATDAMILPLLQTQVLGNEYHKAYLHANFAQPSALSESTMAAFQAKMEDNQSTTPSECWPVDLARLYAASYGHEMDLLNPCVDRAHSPTRSDETMPLTSSRRDCLTYCLHSAAKLYETFLSLPYEEYAKLSVLQWWAIVCDTAYLYRLCLGIPQLPEWDVADAREVAKLEIYLDLLCYRLVSATGSTLEKPTGRDLYSLLCPIFTNVKRSYERLKELPKTMSASDKRPVHADAFSAGQAKAVPKPKLATHPSHCPAFRYTSRADEIGLGPAAQEGNPTETSTVSDIDVFLNSSLFDGDNAWLGDMPSLDLSPFNVDDPCFIATGPHEPRDTAMEP